MNITTELDEFLVELIVVTLCKGSLEEIQKMLRQIENKGLCILLCQVR